jgi:helix-turn-helix protein
MRVIFEGTEDVEIEPSLSEGKERILFSFRKKGNNDIVMSTSLDLEEFYSLHSYLSELIQDVEYEKEKQKSFWSRFFGS